MGKTKEEFLLLALESEYEFQREFFDKMMLEPETQEYDLANTFKSLVELDSKIRTDLEYKKGQGYSTKKELDHLKLINKALSECKAFHKKAYLERSVLKTRINLLDQLCRKIIGVIEKRLDLPEFVEKCIIKLKTYNRT
jgi:hypothetical protein